MTVPSVLDELRREGVHLQLDGLQLRFLVVGGRLTDEMRGQIVRRKDAVYRGFLGRLRAESRDLLPLDPSAWPEDVTEAFEERAGILEFDGGHDREVSEILAEIELRVVKRRRGAEGAWR